MHRWTDISPQRELKVRPLRMRCTCSQPAPSSCGPCVHLGGSAVLQPAHAPCQEPAPRPPGKQEGLDSGDLGRAATPQRGHSQCEGCGLWWAAALTPPVLWSRNPPRGTRCYSDLRLISGLSLFFPSPWDALVLVVLVVGFFIIIQVSFWSQMKCFLLGGISSHCPGWLYLPTRPRSPHIAPFNYFMSLLKNLTCFLFFLMYHRLSP